MPDNAIYYQMAYGILIVMFVAYAWSIGARRRGIARKQHDARQAEGARHRDDAPRPN